MSTTLPCKVWWHNTRRIWVNSLIQLDSNRSPMNPGAGLQRCLATLSPFACHPLCWWSYKSADNDRYCKWDHPCATTITSCATWCYFDFTVGWANSIHRRISFTKRKATKAAKKLPENFSSLQEDFLQRVQEAVVKHRGFDH